MGYFERRRMRKRTHVVLAHAKHLRNQRGDLWTVREHAAVDGGCAAVSEAVGQGDGAAVERAVRDLEACLARLRPVRRFGGFRENFEMFVVAVGVAMGFRTYFVQPFKIPTGSMQPTLYGIHSEARPGRTVMDTLPLKLVKWMILGEWRHEVRARASGHISEPRFSKTDPSIAYYFIAGVRHKLPKDAVLNRQPGQYVSEGTLLWAGIRIAGDHVFVNKVRWNLTRPRRGEIVVFSTRGIEGLDQGTHYIKRLVGLPGERLSIDPPDLVVDGVRVLDPPAIARIARQEDAYAGYQLDPRPRKAFLRRPGDEIELGAQEYFVLGDNTLNSRDGRYWGPLPRSRLLGPAFVVYWPFSSRWGLVSR